MNRYDLSQVNQYKCSVTPGRWARWCVAWGGCQKCNCRYTHRL